MAEERGRWPAFSLSASRRGLGAIAALPLLAAADKPIGVLSLYGHGGPLGLPASELADDVERAA